MEITNSNTGTKTMHYTTPRMEIKLSPESDAYKAIMKRDKLDGNPDIYQVVGGRPCPARAEAMACDVDAFFDNHLADKTDRDPAWDNFVVVNGHFVRKS